MNSFPGDFSCSISAGGMDYLSAHNPSLNVWNVCVILEEGERYRSSSANMDGVEGSYGH